MKKISYTLLFIIMFFCVKCSNDTHDVYDDDDALDYKPELVNVGIGTEPVTKKIKANVQTRANNNGAVGNSDILLGKGYKVGNTIIGDYQNVTYEIVDINKVKALSPKLITPKKLSFSESISYTYTNEDEYAESSQISGKGSGGFSLNVLGIFKIGKKKRKSEIFTQTMTSNSNVVYGERGIYIRNSSFQLQNSQGSRSKYAQSCLSDDFVDDLYESTIENTIKSYGEFVLGGYITGGRFDATYCGYGSSGSSSTTRNSEMSSDLEAGISFKKNSADATLSVGKGSTTGTASSFKTSNTKLYFKILGGMNVPTSNSAITAVNFDLDLTSWLKSLNDENTHTIIDVLDGSLLPISAYILEDNFKRRFDRASNEMASKNEGDSYRTELEWPEIEYRQVFVRTTTNGTPLYEVAPVLTTRHGDLLVLSDGSAFTAPDSELLSYNTKSNFDKRVDAVKNNVLKMFNVGAMKMFNYKLNVNMNESMATRISYFNPDKLYKWKNEETGIVYLYDPQNKFALSFLDRFDFHEIEGNYGMIEFVSRIPEKPIVMSVLASNYKIIGL